MGAGAGQRGGMPQSTPQRMPQAMPQMGMMPPGVPTQDGISALAAQGAQMDPRLAAIMQAMQQQGGMPGAGMMPPGGARFTRELQSPVGPGDVLVQPPLPVGAGGKGAGMPRPGVSTPRVMATPRGQAAQPVDPRLAMMTRGRMR